MKRLTRLISASIFLGLIFILLFSAYTSEAVKRSRRTCSGLEIIIRDSLRNRFVDKADIEDCLISEFGDFKGKAMDSISLVSIEKTVDARSAVRKSEAYMTKDGILHISITQREPVVRFQGKDAGIYADEEGCLFPLQKSYTAHVPVVDGFLPFRPGPGFKGLPTDTGAREWIGRIVEMIRYMNSTGVWDRNIVQINVRENGDLVLIPREGREKFIFGPPVQIEDKFRKMGLYYTSIVPAKGEGFYSTVNLKFEDRIICRK